MDKTWKDVHLNLTWRDPVTKLLREKSGFIDTFTGDLGVLKFKLEGILRDLINKADKSDGNA